MPPHPPATPAPIGEVPVPPPAARCGAAPQMLSATCYLPSICTCHTSTLSHPAPTPPATACTFRANLSKTISAAHSRTRWDAAGEVRTQANPLLLCSMRRCATCAARVPRADLGHIVCFCSSSALGPQAQARPGFRLGFQRAPPASAVLFCAPSCASWCVVSVSRTWVWGVACSPAVEGSRMSSHHSVSPLPPARCAPQLPPFAHK